MYTEGKIYPVDGSEVQPHPVSPPKNKKNLTWKRKGDTFDDVDSVEAIEKFQMAYLTNVAISRPGRRLHPVLNALAYGQK